MRVQVALSKLHPSRRNPRWVKPKPEAQQRMVASIRAFGLLEPLVVQNPYRGKSGEFQVIAGSRRLSALRLVHRQSKEDPKIPCEVRDVDDPTAGAMSLSENFVREAMHPLDEAEAFAKLATDEAKGVEAIASQFGVTERYVRQRMKLAALAEVVKTAFREEQIDTGTAEAFAAVPEERQITIWQELNGSPRHAQQVRSIIAAAWIDAGSALFDVSTLPESAVTRDLFNDQVLVERTAFMEAQTQALAKEQYALREDGWAKKSLPPRQDEVQDRLYAMNVPRQELDERTRRKLARLDTRREKLEAKLQEIDHDDEEAVATVQDKMEGLGQLAREIVQAAPVCFGEKTKAVGTVFLMIDPDGQVRREFRVPRPQSRSANGNGSAIADDSGEQPQPPTSDDLNERQLAATFTHHALAVREALLQDDGARRRLLVLLLHEKVRSEALAMRHDANAVTLQASGSEGFGSETYDRLKTRRAEFDPFVQDHFVEDTTGYQLYQGIARCPTCRTCRACWLESA